MNRPVAMLLIGLIFGGGIGFTIAAGTGVTLDGHDHGAQLLGDAGHHSEPMKSDDHNHSQIISLPEGPNAPTLRIEAFRDGPGWNLHVIVTNFELTPERVGSKHVAGEGHGHVYLNGVKQARLYSEWYHIDKVPDGDVVVRVTLNSNDHSALSVEASLIEATLILRAI